MHLLMLSGDRQVTVGERGPFHAMQREFARWFERIDVLCPRPERPPSVLTIHGNVHFHPADVPRSRLAAWLVEEGRRVLDAHAPRMITSHDYGRFALGHAAAALSRASGVPYLSEIHHVPGYPVAADWRERLERALARRYVRWARTRARAFRVVNATEMPALLERWGVPREQIRVVPSLYVDLETFRPARAAAPPEQDVVFVGRMVASKGVLRLVEALAHSARAGRPRTALLVGKGPELERVRAEVKRRGLEGQVRSVEWVDSPEELAEVYRTSRVCVCASTCEGGPRFTVEALACGTPVVSTRVGMMHDLLADGSAGRLVGFDARSIAAGLDAVLADEDARRAMGEAGVAAAQRFEQSRTIRGYAAALYELAGEPLPAPSEVRPR